jgi:hypothetical protein
VLAPRPRLKPIRRSPLGEGWAQFRGFLTFLLLCAAVGLGIFFYLRNSVDQQLRSALLSHLNRKLASTGWIVNFRRSELLAESGLRIRDLELRHQESSHPALTIDQLLVRVPIDLSNPDAWAIRPEAIILDHSSIKFDLVQWTGPRLTNLLSTLCPLQNPPPPTIPLVVRDSTVRLFHPLSDRFGPVAFHEVQLLAKTGTTTERPLLEIKATSISAEAGSLELHVGIDRCARVFEGWVNFQQLALNEKWLGLLPSSQLPQLQQIRLLRGLLSGQASIAGSLGPLQIDQYRLLADLSEASVEHDLVREPLSSGKATIEIGPDQWKVKQFSSRVGPGTLTAELQLDPNATPRSWELTGDWVDCHFDRELFKGWPAAPTRVLDELNPRGLVNLHFGFRGEETQIRNRQCLVEIRQGQFELTRFPYPVSHCVGTVRLEEENCRVDIQALEAGQVVDIRGEAWGLLSKPTFDFRFSCDGFLPFNEKLVTALQRYPKTLRQVAQLNPRGYFGMSGNFRRLQPGTPNQLEYLIDLKQCAIRHQQFDYPVRDIEGQVRVNGTEVRFEQLRGRNGNCDVRGEGTFRPADGLHLQLTADRVPLNQELRLALQPSTRNVWDSLRPTGDLDQVRLDLRQGTGATRPDIAVDFDIHRADNPNQPDAAIAPVAFPYTFNRLRGNVQIANGRIKMSGLEGEHGQTWLGCNGSGTYETASWRVDLQELQVGGLKIDDDLLAAMPGKLQASCRKLEFVGLLNLAGQLTLQGGPAFARPVALQPPSGSGPVPFDDLRSEPQAAPGFQLDWDIRVDTDGARLKVGLPVENVCGSVRLQGRYDGRSTVCNGQLNLDSLALMKMQVSQVKGPIRLEDNRVGVGLFAAPTGQTAQQSLSGTIYSGQLNFDGQVWEESGTKFYLQSKLANAQLTPLAQIWAPQLQQLSGIAQGEVRLWGNPDAIDSLQGDGTVQLQDAYIFELPVFLATLRQLSRPGLDTRAFDSSLAQFVIRNQQVQFNRLNFTGDALSLIGEGIIDFNRRVDLNFYTMMGRDRFYVPVLTEIARASSQQIFWIEVTGNLANPQTTRKILPVLNDGLRRLLGVPETEPASAPPTTPPFKLSADSLRYSR